MLVKPILQGLLPTICCSVFANPMVTQGLGRSPAPSNADLSNTISQQVVDILFSRESHTGTFSNTFIFSSLPHNQQSSHLLASLVIWACRAKCKVLLVGARKCNTLSFRPRRGPFLFPYSLLPTGLTDTSHRVMETPSPSGSTLSRASSGQQALSLILTTPTLSPTHHWQEATFL